MNDFNVDGDVSIVNQIGVGDICSKKLIPFVLVTAKGEASRPQGKRVDPINKKSKVIS